MAEDLPVATDGDRRHAVAGRSNGLIPAVLAAGALAAIAAFWVRSQAREGSLRDQTWRRLRRAVTPPAVPNAADIHVG